MSAISRYIIRQLLGPFAFITLTLTGVVWLTQSLRFVEKIINANMSATTFFAMTAMLLPSLLPVILPIALFCAILYVYHRLILESEMVVMRASGLSRRRLAVPGVALAIVVMLASYFCTLYLAPLGMRTLRSFKTEWRASLASVVLQEGVFNSISSGVTVYIRERTSGGEVLGILVHDSRDADKPVTYMAERGTFLIADESPRFHMINGNRQEMDRKTDKLSLLYFDRYTVDLGIYTEAVVGTWQEPEEMFVHELLNPADNELNRRNKWRIYAEIHRRASVPLFAIGLALIAVAGILSGEFNRRIQIRRIVATGAAGFLFAALGVGFIQASANVKWLLPMIYVNLLVALAFSLVVLSGRFQFRRRRHTMLAEPT